MNSRISGDGHCRCVLAGLLSALALMACEVSALDWHEPAALAGLFENAGYSGTLAVYDPATDRFRGCNGVRAAQRLVPASTFKIAHTLIGLASGAVADVNEILPYGGAPQPFAAWERDMGLRDAIRISNVPIYQTLARRIGIERMRDGLQRLGYGNQQIGAQVDDFWLRGPLQISAQEQARFLARLARDALPLSPAIQQSVRDIVLIESTDSYRLYAKSGWQNAPQAGVGWWVGWVERQGRVISFALNMDMPGAADAGQRERLARAGLALLGIL